MTTSEGTHKVATSRRPYSPPNKRANWTTAIFALLGFITLFSLFAAIGDIQNHQATQAVGSAADTGVTKTGMLTTAVSMLAAITFLAWQHRASKNIEPLTTKKPKYSPATAVLFWFIPLVSMVLPYLVMKELWKDSHPDGAESPMSPFIGPWWTTWIASQWIGGLIIPIFFSNQSSSTGLIMGDVTKVMTASISLASLLLLTIIMRRITSNQQEIHAQMKGAQEEDAALATRRQPVPAATPAQA